MSRTHHTRGKRTVGKWAGTNRKRSGMKLRTLNGTTRTSHNDQREAQ